jgi:hypothetical protein
MRVSKKRSIDSRSDALATFEPKSFVLLRDKIFLQLISLAERQGSGDNDAVQAVTS